MFNFFYFFFYWKNRGFINFIQDKIAKNWEGYIFAFLLFFSQILDVVSIHNCFWYSYLGGLRAKSALTAIIYRKALKLSNKSRKNTTVGEIVNLISVDCQKIQDLYINLHWMWNAPFVVCLQYFFISSLLIQFSINRLFLS